MDNFDKNQVDKELLEKVEEVLNGKQVEETPELVFSEEVPKDYDITADLYEGTNIRDEAASATTSAGFEPEVERPDAGFNYSAPAAPEFGDAYQQQPQTPKKTDSGNGIKAIIGFAIGVIGVLIAFKGLALGVLPLLVGLFFSKAGLNSDKRVLALIGFVLNIIGVIIFIFAIVKGFL